MACFSILWGSKWLVAGITALATLIAGLYAVTVTPIYRVDVVVGPPSEYAIQALQPSILLDHGRPDETAPVAVPYQVRSVEAQSLYTVAVAQAQSLHIQRRFWAQIHGEGNARQGDAAFDKFARSLQVVAPTSPAAFARISLATPDSEAGVALLTSYLQFVSTSASQRVVGQLDSALEASLARLAVDKTALLQQEKRNLQDELVRLKEAREMAEALGIVYTPYKQFENVRLSFLDEREYLLGTIVLNQHMAAIEARLAGSLEAFVPELRHMERWYEQMEADRQRLSKAAQDVDAMVALSLPEVSLEPISPNRPLIIVVTLCAASFGSVFIVLFRHALRQHHALRGKRLFELR